MAYKFLLEASGTLISAFMIKEVQKAGHRVVASDIAPCAASFLADDFITFPKFSHPEIWNITRDQIEKNGINVVLPSLDETLLKWSELKSDYAVRGVHVIISDPGSIEVCMDKWKTYQFFRNNGIPTPASSLQHEYGLIKPREGRGGQGIKFSEPSNNEDMEGMISQEVLTGQEYTIDVFCNRDNKPVYIVPRLREQVLNGKSTVGLTVKHEEIEKWVRKICNNLPFIGAINIQCFENDKGELKFTEINPRFGGGTALGVTATESWINLIVKNIINGEEIVPVHVKHGLRMYRYYNEVFEQQS